LKSKSFEKKVARQGFIIRKLTKRGRYVKFNLKRITIYEKGKYVGWVNKKEFQKLKRESSVEIKKRGELFKIKFKPIVFEKPVRLKVGKMKKAETRVMKIFTYTKTQRKFVAEAFKKRKIPISEKQPFQKIVDLRKQFKLSNIFVSSFVKGT